MKKIILLIFIMCLLLSACGIQIQKDHPSDSSYPSSPSEDSSDSSSSGLLESDISPDSEPETSFSTFCRIITGAESENRNLLLADRDSQDVYRLVVTEDLYPDTLLDGMMLEIVHRGDIMETYPAQFGEVKEIHIIKDETDTLCSLYLEVLEDLWEVDPGLNSDITELGVDLSETRLTPSEKSAVAWAFAEKHGLFPIMGTYPELVEDGYIDDENLIWEKGCLFSISEQESSSDNSLIFDAQKWCGGLGAYFFMNCTTTRAQDGIWIDYEIGGEAIS